MTSKQTFLSSPPFSCSLHVLAVAVSTTTLHTYNSLTVYDIDGGLSRLSSAGVRQPVGRHLSTTVYRRADTSSPPPPPPPKTSRLKKVTTFLTRATLITILGGIGTFLYVTQKDRHPGPQKPHDPSKKTVVILGSGWGATSLLKHLDTEDWNVVSKAQLRLSLSR